VTDTALRPRPAVLAAALALDVLFVLIFAASGRTTHDRDSPVLGVLDTAWPFLVGLVAGWLLTAVVAGGLRARAMSALVPAGLIVWLSTFAVGMILRAVTDQGTAVSFMAVAAGFLLATLGGWRLIAQVITRMRRRA